MNHSPDSYRRWCRNLFNKYDVEEHLLVLTLSDNLNLDDSQWGRPTGNPYFYELMDGSRVLDGQIRWEENYFFLNLLDQFLNRKITVCEFFEEFEQKEDYILRETRSREENRILSIPDYEAADIFRLTADISEALDKENIFDYCFESSQNEILDLEIFYGQMEKIFRELKELVRNSKD